MALRRIIGSIFTRGPLAVQSIAFKRHLPIGDPVVIAEAFDRWQADEIVLADITASAEGRLVSKELITRATQYLRTPLTVGGGIQTIEQVEDLLRSGADRVFINTTARKNDKFVGEAARFFGSQCIVAWIDVLAVDDTLRVYDHLTRSTLDTPLESWMRELEQRGIGEIILHAVHADGQMQGFDLGLAAYAADVAVPVIISGGAGNTGHFATVFRASEVAGACAGNLFSHSECAITTVKRGVLATTPAIRSLHSAA
ncbi:HisA/HisF-related TIM barrel protein [Prosthecobacter sp.]|jgi:cyclase|uniref:HisA/HisF-related TIM barrel protein n=1 Tax=Prosthecobacter sp. TaxID=1965333 RepID=UPI003784CB7B